MQTKKQMEVQLKINMQRSTYKQKEHRQTESQTDNNKTDRQADMTDTVEVQPSSSVKDVLKYKIIFDGAVERKMLEKGRR
jgi:hypothetical protein